MTGLNDFRTALHSSLIELRLPTVRACFEEVSQIAQNESFSYERYLYELAEREREDRKQRRIARFLKQSCLPLEKDIDTFDLKRLPRKLINQVDLLLEGFFIDKRENVLAFGNPGSGKTHLLCAIGQALIYKGYRLYFTTCSLLVQNLLIAKRDLRLSRLLKSLSKYQALIIDDIGYVQHNREEMGVLFTLLADRYERGSVMITSNLPFSKWEQIFKDPMTTAAAIDRVVHHSVILELNLASYRVEYAQSKMKE